MGVYVSLKIVPARIDPGEWADFYDETVLFLKNGDLKFIGPKEERIILPEGEFKRIIYSQAFEQVKNGKRSWHISGDLETYGMGESFLLYRDLSHYQIQYFLSRDDDNKTLPDTDFRYDIVENLVWEYFEGIDAPKDNRGTGADRNKDKNAPLPFMSTVFDEKTQGHPFHYYMLGVGMLAENRFPRAAYVSGNIDRFQGEEARDKIKSILNKNVSLPLCTDPDALLERIISYHQGVAALKAFHDLLRDDAERDAAVTHQAAIKHLGREVFENWFLGRLKHYEKPSVMGAKDLMMEWLNAGQPLDRLIQLECLHPDGPRHAPLKIAESLVDLWLTIEPEKRNAWQSFDKPQGAADTVASQFGGIFLDMLLGARGRHMKTYIPADEVVHVFSRTFPQEKTAIAEAVYRTTRELEETHAQISKPLADKVKEVQEDPGVLDGVPILQLADEASITKQQHDWLVHFAYFLSFQLAEVKKGSAGTKSLFFHQKNRDDLYTQIVLATSRYGPNLTDQAWQWIDHEQDMDLLTTLVLLALMNKSEQKFYNTKKAIMEKKWLCEVLTRFRMDTEKMHEIGTLMDEMLKAKQEIEGA